MSASATEKPILSAKNMGVYYIQKVSGFRHRKFWALENVTLDLYHGETLGVIGRNGAGKSTLIKLLAGIIAPDRGCLFNSGVRVLRLTLGIGFLPHLSGRENAVLGSMLMGLTHHQAIERMDATIEFTELGQFIDQPVRTYSSGMKARLGFSIALQSDPDVLLLDETLGVGDASFREKSTKALQKLIRSDKTVVLVSHSPQTIRSLCDRALWIEERVSRQEGEVDEILAAYAAHLEEFARIKSSRESSLTT